MNEIKLEFADLFGPQLIGRLVEVPAEPVRVVCIGIDRFALACLRPCVGYTG